MKVVLTLGVLWVVVSTGWAQTPAVLTGQVRDATGAAVSRAEVLLRSARDAGTRSTHANLSGDFRFEALTEGDYVLEVKADGFEPDVRAVHLTAQSPPEHVVLETAGISVAVTVTAARTAIPASEIPRAVSVIDAGRLAERPGALALQGLLAEVPGISFARSGSLGGQIVLRGFNSNSNRSVLAVDGDRFRGRSTLEFNLFDPNAIDRLEVVRGPASAAYGADAMNGVVNIFTQRSYADTAGPFRLTPHLLALDLGSNGRTFAARPAVVGGGRGADVFIGGSLRRSGDYRTPLGEVENSDFLHRGIDGRIGYTLASSRLEVAGRYQVAETGRAGGIGGAPGAPLRVVREEPMRERFLRLGYQDGSSRPWLGSLSGSLYTRRLRTDIYQVNRTVPTVTVETHTGVYTPTIWGGRVFATKVSPTHRVTYGLEFFDERGYGRPQETTRRNPVTDAILSQTAFVPAERGGRQTNVGVLVNDNWTPLSRLTVSGGVRLDVIWSSLDTVPVPSETQVVRDAYARALRTSNRPATGSIGVVLRPTESLDVTGNWSRSFRVPATGERVGQAGTIITLPSPDLAPEEGHTVEAGLRWHGRRRATSVTAFRSEYSNLIQSVPVTPTQRQARNVGEARISGIEVDGQARVAERWSGRYTVSAIRGTNRTTGVPLPSLAPFAARAAIRYEGQAGWYAETGLAAFRGTTRIDSAQERPRPGYATVDTYAGMRLDRWAGSRWGRWRLIGGVTNLLDQAGRNPASTEDVAFSNTLLSNPLYEPGRAFVLKLSSSY